MKHLLYGIAVMYGVAFVSVGLLWGVSRLLVLAIRYVALLEFLP